MIDLDSLDDDPEVAFAQLAREFERQFISENDDDVRGHRHYDICMKYMVNVLAAASALGLESFADTTIPDNDGNYFTAFQRFRHAVSFYVVRAEISLKKDRGKYSVGLSITQKNEICGYLDRVRGILEQANLDQRKLEQLLTLLSALRTEVEQPRTKFARVSDVVRRIVGLSKDIEETGARPWFKYIMAIYGVFDDAKEEEVNKLPKEAEAKRLPPPPKGLSSPKPDSPARDMDDEIPF